MKQVRGLHSMFFLLLVMTTPMLMIAADLDDQEAHMFLQAAFLVEKLANSETTDPTATTYLGCLEEMKTRCTIPSVNSKTPVMNPECLQEVEEHCETEHPTASAPTTDAPTAAPTTFPTAAPTADPHYNIKDVFYEEYLLCVEAEGAICATANATQQPECAKQGEEHCERKHHDALQQHFSTSTIQAGVGLDAVAGVGLDAVASTDGMAGKIDDIPHDGMVTGNIEHGLNSITSHSNNTMTSHTQSQTLPFYPIESLNNNNNNVGKLNDASETHFGVSVQAQGLDGAMGVQAVQAQGLDGAMGVQGTEGGVDQMKSVMPSDKIIGLAKPAILKDTARLDETPHLERLGPFDISYMRTAEGVARTVWMPALQNKGSEYCDTTVCGLCEGDCDDDTQCSGTLRCFQRSRNDPIPGCTVTSAPADYDFCYDATFWGPRLQNKGGEYCDTTLCGECEGDCDDDDQCSGFRQCFQRQNNEPIPGCAVSPAPADYDFCYSSFLQNLGGNYCTTSNLCGQCQGDCDTDSQCEGTSKCFQRSNNEPIPGCAGARVPVDYDFCYDAVLSTALANLFPSVAIGKKKNKKKKKSQKSKKLLEEEQ